MHRFVGLVKVLTRVPPALGSWVWSAGAQVIHTACLQSPYLQNPLGQAQGVLQSRLPASDDQMQPVDSPFHTSMSQLLKTRFWKVCVHLATWPEF